MTVVVSTEVHRIRASTQTVAPAHAEQEGLQLIKSRTDRSSLIVLMASNFTEVELEGPRMM
jgi:hypothetical protein